MFNDIKHILCPMKNIHCDGIFLVVSSLLYLRTSSYVFFFPVLVPWQAISSWFGEIWERWLAKHISEFCGNKNSYASGKPRTEVLHTFEFNEQGQKEIKHSWYHQCQQWRHFVTSRANNRSSKWFCSRFFWQVNQTISCWAYRARGWHVRCTDYRATDWRTPCISCRHTCESPCRASTHGIWSESPRTWSCSGGTNEHGSHDISNASHFS